MRQYLESNLVTKTIMLKCKGIRRKWSWSLPSYCANISSEGARGSGLSVLSQHSRRPGQDAKPAPQKHVRIHPYL